MNKLIKKVAVAVLSVGLTIVSGQVAAKDSSKPIVIATHNWDSQIVMAYVIGGIFESMGNNVEYVPLESQAVYEAVRNGDVTIAHEVWQSTMGKSFYNSMKKGGLIDAGTHEAATWEEAGVPQWVIDENLCPGLPNWEALKDCAEVFSTPDSDGKGRLLEGPQSWHGEEYVDRFEALFGDTWTVKFAGSSAAIWAEHAAAKKEGRATLTFNWTPNFTDVDGFVFIEFPPWYTDCRKQDGGDSKCGSPKGWLKKAAHYQMPKRWPNAYMAWSQISFNAAQIGKMAELSNKDLGGLTHKDAATQWLADNEDVWKAWTRAPM